MLKRIYIVIFWFGFCLNAAFAADDWQINLKNADIRAFVSQVSDITGKSFVVDPRVKGRVNVLSTKPMDKQGVYELFLSVLRVHGYAALPAGDVTLIVQQNAIKQQGAGIDTKAGKTSQEVITKVIEIKNTPALDLVPILRPLVAKYGHLAGVRSANAIIVSDHARNIARIEQIIQRLDTSGVADIEVIQLKEAWVGSVVQMLQSLDPSKIANGKSQGNRSQTAGSLRVVADENTNRLILKGERSALNRIKQLVEKLDQPSFSSGSAKVIRLQYADAKKLAELLKGFVAKPSSGKKDDQKVKGQSSVYADEELNALVVRAEPTLLKEIQTLVNELDVRRTQVLIEAAIVEVSGKIGDALGVQWASAEKGQPIVATNFDEAGTTLAGTLGSVAQKTLPTIASGLTLGAFGGGSGDRPAFAVLVQALAGESRNNLLATPSIMTLDNQEAEIVVGQNVPFRTGSTSSSNNSNPFTTIKRQDIGVRLKVKPHVHDGDALRLEVEATQESVTRSPIQGSSDISTDKSSIKTTILADNESTVVLGGLIRDDVKEIESKVPLLGDIPLLGWLFKSKSVTKDKKNLMLFLKPTIITGSERSNSLTREKFNGIWEFSLSERLTGDVLNERIDGMFYGKPVGRERLTEDDDDSEE